MDISVFYFDKDLKEKDSHMYFSKESILLTGFKGIL